MTARSSRLPVSTRKALSAAPLSGRRLLLTMYWDNEVERRSRSLRRWVSRWVLWRFGRATKTMRKIKPAIAKTSTTSMIVKPFLELIFSFVIFSFPFWQRTRYEIMLKIIITNLNKKAI